MQVKMQHTEETIHRLAKVQYDTYCMGQKLVSFALALVLLLLGTAKVFGNSTSLVLIAFGCWSLMGMNVPARRNARKIIEWAKGNLPVSELQFSDDCIHIRGDGKDNQLKYEDIYSLISDGEYLYLFISRNSAYMLPIGNACGEELRNYISRRCALPVERPGSLLRFNLKSATKMFTCHREKK